MTLQDRHCVICGGDLRPGQSHHAIVCRRGVCRRAHKRTRRRRWYEANRAAQIAYATRYAIEHRDKINAARRKNIQRQCVVCEATFIARGAEKTCSKTCRRDSRYVRERFRRARNLEKCREQKRARYAANPRKFIEQNRIWLLANPEKREKYRQHKQLYYLKNLARFKDYRAAQYAAERPIRLEMARQKKAEMLAAVRVFRRLCGEHQAVVPDQRTITRRKYYRSWYARKRDQISERRQRQRISNANAILASERLHNQEQRAILRTFRGLGLTK